MLVRAGASALRLERVNTGLADRAEIFRIATAFACDPAARAPELLATVPAGDDATAAAPSLVIGAAIETLEAPSDSTSLVRLQTHPFGSAAAHETAPDESVVVLSAPGESRECVRRLGFARARAAAGTHRRHERRRGGRGDRRSGARRAARTLKETTWRTA